MDIRSLCLIILGEVLCVLSTSSSFHRGLKRPSGSGSRATFPVWCRRAATVMAGLLALIMAYGVMFGHNGLTVYANKRNESRMLLLQSQQLERENNRLQGHVDRLQSDPGSIEHQAREELHYTRAGEVIYTLPDTVATAPSTHSAIAH